MKHPIDLFFTMDISNESIEDLSGDLELLMIEYEKCKLRSDRFESAALLLECMIRGMEVCISESIEVNQLLIASILEVLNTKEGFEGSMLQSRLSLPHKTRDVLIDVERRLRSKEEVEFEEIEQVMGDMSQYQADPSLRDACKYVSSVHSKLLAKHSRLLTKSKTEPMFAQEIQDMISTLKKSHIQFNTVIDRLKENLKRAEEFQDQIKRIDKNQLKNDFLKLRDEYYDINVRMNNFEELLQVYEKEEYFINNMDSIIREELNIRRVFALLNRVVGFKLHKTSGVNILLMNKCIDALRKRFHSFKKDAGITKESDDHRAISDYLNGSDLQHRVIVQLVKLCKKLKLRAESKDVDWEFKESLNREKNKLSQNYTYFKKFLLRDHQSSGKKTSENKKDSRKYLRATPSVRRSRDRHHKSSGRDPHRFSRSSVDGDSIAHPRDIRQVMFHEIREVFVSTPAYGFSELETVVAAKKLEDKLRMKIKKPQHYEAILEKILKLLRLIRDRKHWNICRFLKNMNFKPKILAKLTLKSEKQLMFMERHFEEKKMYNIDLKIVDLEKDSDIEGFFEDNYTPRKQRVVDDHTNKTRARNYGVSQNQRQSVMLEDKINKKESKHRDNKVTKPSMTELFSDIAPLSNREDGQPIKRLKGDESNNGSGEEESNQFDKRCEELARNFRKRTERILAGDLRFGELSDSHNGFDTDDEDDEDELPIMDEKMFSVKKIREQECYYRLFQGKFKINDNDSKRKQYTEIYSAFGVDFIKLFTKIKEGTPLSLKPNNQQFKNYIDKILLGPDRQRYIVLPAYTKCDNELAIKSLFNTSGSVVSMQYSEKCKVFLFPRDLLRSEWLDIINYAVIKTKEIETFDILCFLVCKLNDSTKEEPISPIKVKIEKTDQIVMFNKNTSHQENAAVKMTFIEEDYDQKVKMANKQTKQKKKNKEGRREERESRTYLGKRNSSQIYKKHKLLRLVEEPEQLLREFTSNRMKDISRNIPVDSKIGVVLPDSPLLSKPPKNKNESAHISSMNILRGESSSNKKMQGEMNMALDLDPFSSNLYDDREDRYSNMQMGVNNTRYSRQNETTHRAYTDNRQSNNNISLFKGFVE